MPIQFYFKFVEVIKIKLIGAVMILCACACACAFYEKGEKNKIFHLASCYDYIRYIKTQIEYFSMPIDTIHSSYEPKSELCDALIANEGIDKLFEKEDATLISGFFSSLGKGMKNEELSLCSYTIEELEKRIERKKSDYPNKIKVFRATALFIGFCTIILLI